MKVFLTGASGYAGFHAALRLATKAAQAVSD
jgi:nucleoside-diphosphate-sugar epimerase